MVRLPRQLLIPVVLHITSVAALSAQAEPVPWPRNPLIILPGPVAHQSSLISGPVGLKAPDTYRDTYWKEGGIAGAILLGIVGILLVDNICKDSDTAEQHCGTRAVGGGALGAAVGFGLGALVGGQFKKGP